METPYSYLQVEIQEHPTPFEFPPPFSIEEFNLYHHGYPPHMNYDKNAFYMNQLASATAGYPPNPGSRSSHKQKSYGSKHHQPQQQQHQQHQSQQHQQPPPPPSSLQPPPPQQPPLPPSQQPPQTGQEQQQQQQQQHTQHQQQHAQHQQLALPSVPPAGQTVSGIKEVKAEPIKREPTAQSSAGSSELSPASTGHEEMGKDVLMKQLVRAKHTLQQRIKRQNETPEQKALRRQRNAELNRKRRQNKEDIRVTIEKTKNRLRQRIKREIDRMLRTRQKRDDFLRETFEQMATVFSETDMMQCQERVASVIGEISNWSTDGRPEQEATPACTE